MRKQVARMLSSPSYPGLLVYAGKYAAVLQLIAAVGFYLGAWRGLPLGALTYAEGFRDAALTTLTLTACLDLIFGQLRSGDEQRGK